MYNVGDKFIVEIETAYGAYASHVSAPDDLYRIKGLENLVVDRTMLDKLERYAPGEKSEKDFGRGYEAGLAEAQQLVADRLRVVKQTV